MHGKLVKNKDNRVNQVLLFCIGSFQTWNVWSCWSHNVKGRARESSNMQHPHHPKALLHCVTICLSLGGVKYFRLPTQPSAFFTTATIEICMGKKESFQTGETFWRLKRIDFHTNSRFYSQRAILIKCWTLKDRDRKWWNFTNAQFESSSCTLLIGAVWKHLNEKM